LRSLLDSRVELRKPAGHVLPGSQLPASEIDPAARERLRALGYIE